MAKKKRKVPKSPKRKTAKAKKFKPKVVKKKIQKAKKLKKFVLKKRKPGEKKIKVAKKTRTIKRIKKSKRGKSKKNMRTFLRRLVKKIQPAVKTVSSQDAKKIRKPAKSSKETDIKPEKIKTFLEENGVRRTRIRVIGIGGGGGSIVSELASRVRRATFVAANTDFRALKETKHGVMRFQFGQNVTQGLGTGMNVELGTLAAESDQDKIQKILEGQDFVIVIGCLGGGAGSGAASTFARISRRLGIVTYGIFTLPFNFEGEKKMELAQECLAKIRPNFNAISIIPNERIFQVIDKTTPLQAALSAINRILAESLEGLIETICEPGLINIDFADLRAIMTDKGRLAYLNTVAARGDDRAGQAIQKAFSNPLYPYGIKGARGILYNIVGEKGLSLAEVSQMSKSISQLVNKGARIIFGVNQAPRYEGMLKITLLATGCAMPALSRQSTESGAAGRNNFLAGATKESEKKIEAKKNIAAPKISEKTKPKVASRRKKIPKPEDKQKKERKKNIQPPEKNSEQNPSISPAETPERKYNEQIDLKVRRNALQIKKEIEEQEKEILNKETIWDTPAFLRNKNVQSE